MKKTINLLLFAVLFFVFASCEETPTPVKKSDLKQLTLIYNGTTIAPTGTNFSFTLPYGSSASAVSVTLGVSAKASLQSNAQTLTLNNNSYTGNFDFSKGSVSFTVTAEDGSTQVYVVTAIMPPTQYVSLTGFLIGGTSISSSGTVLNTSITPSLKFNFSDTINLSSAKTNISLKKTSDNSIVASSITQTTTNPKEINISPASPLDYQTEYYVSISQNLQAIKSGIILYPQRDTVLRIKTIAKPLDNNHQLGVSYNQTPITPQDTNFEVSLVYGASLTSVPLTLSVATKASLQFNAQALTLTDNAYTGNFDFSKGTLSFTVTAEDGSRQVYVVKAVLSPDQYLSLSGFLIDGVMISTNTPTQDIVLKPKLTLNFSDTILLSSVTQETISLKKTSDNSVIPVVFSVMSDKKQINVSPTSDLTYFTDYSISISKDIKATKRNVAISLEKDTTFYFKTQVNPLLSKENQLKISYNQTDLTPQGTTFTVALAYGTSPTSIPLALSVSPKATLQFNAQPLTLTNNVYTGNFDFSSQRRFVVTSESGLSQSYTVSIILPPKRYMSLNSFLIDQQSITTNTTTENTALKPTFTLNFSDTIDLASASQNITLIKSTTKATIGVSVSRTTTNVKQIRIIPTNNLDYEAEYYLAIGQNIQTQKLGENLSLKNDTLFRFKTLGNPLGLKLFYNGVEVALEGTEFKVSLTSTQNKNSVPLTYQIPANTTLRSGAYVAASGGTLSLNLSIPEDLLMESSDTKNKFSYTVSRLARAGESSEKNLTVSYNGVQLKNEQNVFSIYTLKSGDNRAEVILSLQASPKASVLENMYKLDLVNQSYTRNFNLYTDVPLTVIAEDGSSTLYTVRYVPPVTPSGNSEYDNFSTTYSRSLGWTSTYHYTENGNKRFPFGSTLWVGKNLSQGDFYQTFVTYGVSEGYYKFKTNYVNGMFFTGEFTVTKAMAEQTSVALRFKLKARGTPQQAGTFNYTLFEGGDNFTITVLNASDSAVAIENNRIPLPATGTLLNELTFNATQTTEKFRYENGWSGTGFNMVGSQRGVPEITRVIEDPSQAGNYVLQMHSYNRDAQWRADNSIIVGGGGNAIYDGDDGETQDDIWYYGNKTFNAENELNTYGQMYLPASLYWNGFRTATNVKNLSTSTYGKGYFGIFVTSRGLMVRAASDCYYSFPQRGITDKSGWWTFGISTKKTTHEMFFFAKQGKSNAFTSDDLIGRLSDWSTPLSYEGVLSDGPLIYISMDNPFTTSFSIEESIFLDNVRMFKGIN